MIKLTHVHGSHAQDIPLGQLAPPVQFTADSSFLNCMKLMSTETANANKLSFCDRDGKHCFLFPNEILFLKAANQSTTINTGTNSFLASGLLTEHESHLPPQFQRIQKSYIVNTQYIDTIYRYKAILKDGQELPIRKIWYMDLKRFLQKKRRTPERPNKVFA